MTRFPLLFTLLCLPLSASPLVVQNPMAPLKTATELQAGQRFECLEDVRFTVYGCPILLRKGTIGFRVDEATFFIAKGTVRIGALPPAPRFGTPRPPLTFRSFHAELEATGSEWLSVKAGELRWLKEANTGYSSISIDGLRLRGEEGHMLISRKSSMVLVAPAEDGEAFSMADLENLSYEELLLRHRRVRDAQAALSFRSLPEQRTLPDSSTDWQLRRLQELGTRYGSRP